LSSADNDTTGKQDHTTDQGIPKHNRDKRYAPIGGMHNSSGGMRSWCMISLHSSSYKPHRFFLLFLKKKHRFFLLSLMIPESYSSSE
jgi:hypothetical protein